MIPGTRASKIDTDERLAWAVGKNPRTYQSADDYNYLANRLSALWSLIYPDMANVHPSRKVNLGTITGSFITWINTHAAITFPEPSFLIYKIGEVEYIHAFVGYGANYGTGTNQVSDAMFVLLTSSDVEEPALPTRRVFFAEFTDVSFTVGKNTLQETVTYEIDGDYLKTNILFFPSLHVEIIDRWQHFLEGGGAMQREYYNRDGYLAFSSVIYDSEGGITLSPDGFNGVRILIEQL